MILARVPLSTVIAAGHLDPKRFVEQPTELSGDFSMQIVILASVLDYCEVGTVVPVPDAPPRISLYSTDFEINRLAKRSESTRKVFDGLADDLIFLTKENKAIFYEELVFRSFTDSQDCFIFRCKDGVNPLFLRTFLSVEPFLSQVPFLSEKISVIEKRDRLQKLKVPFPDGQGQEILAQTMQEGMAKADHYRRVARRSVDDAEAKFLRIFKETQLKLGV